MASDKQINIGVGADISGLKTGMDSAAKTVQDAGKKMETAAKEATAKTESSFKNLSQAYRATAKDAYEIALKQGTQSAAFREAITTAGQYKDELDQVKNSINVLSSDTPILTGALGLGQGLAGAFSAAQGAMALFGAESEDVQKALLKVQGAMALTQGLQAVGQLGDAFSSFGDVIDVKVLPGLRSLGALLAANPITLVVGAVVGLSAAYAALAHNTDRAATAERNYVAINHNASSDIIVQTEKLREQNKELAIQAAAKQKGIEVDAERVNIAKQENIELQNKLDALQKNVKYQDASTESGLLNNINIKNQVLELQNQINANKDLISAYKEKIRLEGIINAKDLKVGGGNLLNQVRFTPVIDTNAVEDLTGLMEETGSELAASLDGAFSPIDFTIADMQQKISDFATEVEKTLIQGAANAFAQFGQMVGESMAGANANFEQAGMAMIASLASTIGSGMIALGIPMLFSALTAGEGAALIAGGTALNVLAGSLNAGSQKKISPTSRGGGGGYSPNNGFSGFTPTDNTFSINSRLIGTDLLLSVQKSSKKMDRIR